MGTTRNMPSGNGAIRWFGWFRQLVSFIASKQETEEMLEPFDLLDFEAYDKMLRQKEFG